METLGARLRLLQLEHTKNLASTAGSTSSETRSRPKPYVPGEQDREAVNKLWEGVRTRATAMVRELDARVVEMTLGTLGFGAEPLRAGDSAASALAMSCLPLTIPVGLADDRNPFNAGWRELCGWAMSEELYPEIELRHGTSEVQTELWLRLKPLPTTS